MEGPPAKSNTSSEEKYTPDKEKKGKSRIIDPPKPEAKRLFRRLHRYLTRHIPAHGGAHGGVRGRSCFTSARKHLGKRHVVIRDVDNCYPSISTEQLRQEMLRNRYRSDVAWLLSRLFTVHGRIPQGSPLSSDALNIFLYRSDNVISSACGRHAAEYGRVYDDHVASFDADEFVDIVEEIMERQIAKAGLEINRRKCEINGHQPAHRRQLVHGLVVNSKRGIRIAPEQSKKALHAAESYLASARVVDADSIQMVAYKRQVVHGWMHQCRQAEHSPAKQIYRLLKAGDRKVEARLKQHGLARFCKAWWVNSKRKNPRLIARAWRRV